MGSENKELNTMGRRDLLATIGAAAAGISEADIGIDGETPGVGRMFSLPLGGDSQGSRAINTNLLF
jgi:hypothetical protein